MIALDYYRAALWSAAGFVVLIMLGVVVFIWWAIIFPKRPSDKIGEE